MKQPTTQQRFDSIMEDADEMSKNAGMHESTAFLVKTAKISGIQSCLAHLKNVHLTGGNAGEFLNELDAICTKAMAHQAGIAIAKMNESASKITDQIVKPEEN